MSVLSTNVHFSFDKYVEEGVQEFKVQVSCDDFKDDISTFKIGDPSDRMCTLADLTPVKEFGVRVVAVYKDGARGKSEASTFKTQGMCI